MMLRLLPHYLQVMPWPQHKSCWLRPGNFGLP